MRGLTWRTGICFLQYSLFTSSHLPTSPSFVWRHGISHSNQNKHLRLDILPISNLSDIPPKPTTLIQFRAYPLKPFLRPHPHRTKSNTVFSVSARDPLKSGPSIRSTQQSRIPRHAASPPQPRRLQTSTSLSPEEDAGLPPAFGRSPARGRLAVFRSSNEHLVPCQKISLNAGRCWRSAAASLLPLQI